MTRIGAYTALQDTFGKEQAQIIAEYLETQNESVDVSKLATKEDLNRFATKEDLNRFAAKEDLKDLEIRLLKEIQKSREDLMTRMQWTAFIQIVTTIAALIGLSKLI